MTLIALERESYVRCDSSCWFWCLRFVTGLLFFWCGDLWCLSVTRDNWLLATKHLWSSTEGIFDAYIPPSHNSFDGKISLRGSNETAPVDQNLVFSQLFTNDRKCTVIIFEQQGFDITRFLTIAMIPNFVVIMLVILNISRVFLSLLIRYEY